MSAWYVGVTAWALRFHAICRRKKSASVGKGTYLARESEVMNQFLLTTPLLVREWLAVLQFMGPRRTGVSLGRLSLSCNKKCAVAPMRGRYQRPSKPSETP